MKRQTKKLFKGIALFASFYLTHNFIGESGLYKIEKQILLCLDFLPNALATIMASLSIIVIGCTMIYFFCSGLYRICTFHLRIPEFEK
jgi:hypothetical protein